MTLASWIRLTLIVVAILALELACRMGLISRLAVVPPSIMVLGLVRALSSVAVLIDLGWTFLTVTVAIVASVIGGFVLGFILHGLPRVRNRVEPLLAVYYAVPNFAFYPLLIVLFGLGVGPLVVLGTMYGIVAMLASTLLAFDRVPRVMSRTARVFHLSPLQEILRIRLPAALPWLFAGVKLAIAYSLIGVIAGEFILSTKGIGHRIAFAYDNFDIVTMYGLILFVLLLVGGVNMLLHSQEQRLMRTRTNG
jgi:NitT/TauT family transport system permease protein